MNGNKRVVRSVKIADWRTLLMAILAPLLFGACTENGRREQPIHDILITWKPWLCYDRGAGPNIPFYIDNRLAGFGEKGIRTVIERLGRLPSSTSVVWGPDGAKYSDGPGNDVVARDFFPKGWKQFLQVAKDRGLVLSSFGEGFGVDYGDELLELRDALYVTPDTPRDKSDVLLKWSPPKGKDASDFQGYNVAEWPVYYLDDRESGRDAGGFLATLKALRNYPDHSRLRIVWYDTERGSYQLPGINMFVTEFRDVIAAKRPRLVIECDKKRWPKYANCPNRCRFEWRQIRTDTLTPEEVVYLIDGKAAGVGKAGFNVVLKKVRRLPQGAYLEYPQYCVAPHAACPGKEREAFALKDPVPFWKRRKELSDLVRQNHLVVGRTRSFCFPQSECGGRVYEELEAEQFLRSLLQFAKIVRDGARRVKADAIISWKQKQGEWRRPIGEATYFYNGEKSGIGTNGFLAILKRLESLSNGTRIRIDPVCVRTHAPFLDPVVMKGQRHFETTGEEPFRGMVDLLAEVVQRKQFRVDVIPDEGKPYHCPGGR